MNASTRSGTILIIVAGISALLASLALAFLARMRSDSEESQYLLQHAQAKIMLAAACNYVQESSRLGWDRYPFPTAAMPSPPPPSTLIVDGLNIHEEAFGWVDVRTGAIGPLNKDQVPFTSGTAGVWPSIGAHVRCPMYTMKRPPFSIRMHAGHNLIATNNPGAPDYCQPLLRYPDPQPVASNNWTTTGGPTSINATNYSDFAIGDRTPNPETQGRAWFRVYRDGPATFLVTCAAGGTEGFKSWAEIMGENKGLQFNNDRSYFESLRNTEVRLHYRIIWTAAVTETSYHNLQHEIGQDTDHYETWPPNASHTWSSSRRTQTWMKNPVGTILSIQRLTVEPTFW
jgi:hypothetical protein